MGLDSNQNPNPKTQKNKPQTQTETQKFLGFKNNLFLLRYFNEHIFSFFLNPNIFGFWSFFGSLGMDSNPDPKKTSTKPKPPNPKTQRNQVPNPNPTKLKQNRLLLVSIDTF